MLKKLTEDKQRYILEIGISEFAEHGVDRASMGAIARKAGISVGVLYKYYADKDTFFDACLSRSLDELNDILRNIEAQDRHMISGAEAAVRAVQRCAREHRDYLRMYHRIAAQSSGEYAKKLAAAIEGVTADAYARRIAEAQAAGDVRGDMDPRMLAFFFDNLLMMLQDSYSSDYYRERFRRYCGEEAAEDEDFVASQLIRFLECAFTFESGDIRHKNRGEDER